MKDEDIRYSISRGLFVSLRAVSNLSDMDVMGTITDIGNAQVEAAQKAFAKNPGKRDFHSRRKIKFPETPITLLYRMNAGRQHAHITIEFDNSNKISMNRHEIMEKVLETHLLGEPDEPIL